MLHLLASVPVVNQAEVTEQWPDIENLDTITPAAPGWWPLADVIRTIHAGEQWAHHHHLIAVDGEPLLILHTTWKAHPNIHRISQSLRWHHTTHPLQLTLHRSAGTHTLDIPSHQPVWTEHFMDHLPLRACGAADTPELITIPHIH